MTSVGMLEGHEKKLWWHSVEENERDLSLIVFPASNALKSFINNFYMLQRRPFPIQKTIQAL